MELVDELHESPVAQEDHLLQVPLGALQLGTPIQPPGIRPQLLGAPELLPQVLEHLPATIEGRRRGVSPPHNTCDTPSTCATATDVSPFAHKAVGRRV